MKKSKFLLLGSVASLVSIPFVAAKCGETKEEKKPEPDKNQVEIKTLEEKWKKTGWPKQGGDKDHKQTKDWGWKDKKGARKLKKIKSKIKHLGKK
nr:variable surface lipoprotein [Mycoplasmopsis bovis]